MTFGGTQVAIAPNKAHEIHIRSCLCFFRWLTFVFFLAEPQLPVLLAEYMNLEVVLEGLNQEYMQLPGI